MELKVAFFAILIGSMFIIATGVIINEWAAEYESGVVSDLGDYEKLSIVSEQIDEMKGQINPQSGEASSDYEAETFRGAYGIVTGGRYMWRSFRVLMGLGGVIDDLSERWGIPYWIPQTVVAMIMIALILSMVAIIFRLARTSA